MIRRRGPLEEDEPDPLEYSSPAFELRAGAALVVVLAAGLGLAYLLAQSVNSP